jgi:hypothetical protein
VVVEVAVVAGRSLAAVPPAPARPVAADSSCPHAKATADVAATTIAAPDRPMPATSRLAITSTIPPPAWQLNRSTSIHREVAPRQRESLKCALQ